MSFHPIAYSPIPEDTRRAAAAQYGKGNIYLRLGDHYNELLADLIPLEFKPFSHPKRSLETYILNNFLTVFQYAEEMTNDQIVEAVRNRVDLKYALHLPINFPRFDPNLLCEFRRQQFTDPCSAEIFQSLLERLVGFGLLKPAGEQPLTAQQVLVSVCTVHRFDEVVEAMYQALETLAVTDPEWLRRTALPYWYDRYNRSARLSSMPFSENRWNARVLQIGADIQYLLGEIDQANNPGLKHLREIQALRHIWIEQFRITPGGIYTNQRIEWMLTRCAFCSTLN